MKKSLLYIGILTTAIGNCFSQANPGYLGKQNSLELTTSLNFGTLFGLVVASANAYNSTIGVGFEHSFSKNFSLAGGMRYGSVNIDANTLNSNIFYDLTTDLAIQQPDQSQAQQVYNIKGGTTVSSLTEFHIAPRFYIKNKGNIAPLGAFVGTELAMGLLTITQSDMNMVAKNGDNVTMTASAFNASVYSFTLQCGIKRMITNEFGIQAQYGMGLILSQGIAESAYFNEFPIHTYGSLNALVRDGIVNDIAFNKLMQLHVSAVYLF